MNGEEAIKTVCETYFSAYCAYLRTMNVSGKARHIQPPRLSEALMKQLAACSAKEGRYPPSGGTNVSPPPESHNHPNCQCQHCDDLRIQGCEMDRQSHS
ncbi:hypothetical protein LCGC14_0236220 [marine sediment metagenome]|uniref:Uncharacterized protein n=1 Tax=marine sediment metagenome TaxID=412755 RepID=A0A0F9WTZ8_9ZZZZ